MMHDFLKHFTLCLLFSISCIHTRKEDLILYYGEIYGRAQADPQSLSLQKENEVLQTTRLLQNAEVLSELPLTPFDSENQT